MQKEHVIIRRQPAYHGLTPEVATTIQRALEVYRVMQTPTVRTKVDRAIAEVQRFR